MSEQIADAIANPAKYTTLPGGELPVGSILPVTRPPGATIQLPAGWVVAAGQTLDDPESPFHTHTLPRLTDGRFLMGSLSEFGKYGGVNALPGDGNHRHERQQIGSPGFGDDHPDNQFRTADAGGHDHGGENRPAYFGVLFLIKIKHVP